MDRLNFPYLIQHAGPVSPSLLSLLSEHAMRMPPCEPTLAVWRAAERLSLLTFASRRCQQMKRREQIEAMLRDDPSDGFLHYALALELAAEGDLGQATDLLQKLLVEQPDYIPAYLQAGQFLVKQGNLPAARELLAQGMTAASAAQDEHAAEEMASLLGSISD